MQLQILHDGSDTTIGFLQLLTINLSRPIVANIKRRITNSKDPLGIYKLLIRSKEKDKSKSGDLIFPPGFTSDAVEETVVDNNSGSINQPNANLHSSNEGFKMNFLSLNIQGLGQSTKKRWIHDLNRKHRVNFVAIQETKMENIDLFSIKAIWGKFSYDYAFSPSVGCSGDLSEKRTLLEYISLMIDSWEGESVILGDFNKVRSEQERFGTTFNALEDNQRSNASGSSIQSRLSELDKFLDQGKGTKGLVNERSMLQKELQDINVTSSLDMAQKAKIRWSIEGDENSKVKWRGWIQGCLNSAMGSILVNGSSTSEFKFHKGLKQGDPLSPFLFILVLEILHLSFKNILNAGLYKGIHINDSLTLSDLFYADDAVFIGLKINLHKSKLKGIGIPQDDVNMAANSIGCTTLTMPFNYLGVKVGAFSSRSSSWEDILAKISSRLSKWKLKTLSIAIYGDRGALDNPGILLDILLGSISFENSNLCLLKEDSWFTDSPLQHIYPWLYALDHDKHASVAAKIRDSSMINSFTRAHRGGLEEEQLLLLVDKVDSVILTSLSVSTRWVNVVHIKINILAWRVCLDKLPTRLNLSLRGIDIPFILCPICSSAGETTSHLLFSCNVARHILLKVARWWELEIQDFHSYAVWLSWFKALRLSKGLKDVLKGVFYIMWWEI
uniref:RNA-directed DNA polymerase, eukaryota n=1 Tax=Tanacetum cinerariifolium TaxID=118510 RepID=A0A6L2NV57_TANCI|nr:RNA-directed DNA polymerase, eukaryota [Tanacetum cinerariifolium]